MNKKQYSEFLKRYDKFKKNNLPTPFWDDERMTFEYVYFYHYNERKTGKCEERLEVSPNLTEALGEIVYTGFYYPFIAKKLRLWHENGEEKRQLVIGPTHAHSFEEVVRALYEAPESFAIRPEDEKFYSEQERKYLEKVKNYLLFLGLTDRETPKFPVARYRNKKQAKYEDAYIYTVKDKTLRDILAGKINFRVIDWYPEHGEERVYKPGEYTGQRHE